MQRNGRIDRIGSEYDRVYARCFFPDERLNQLLTLEERIRAKLAQAAASVGMKTAPVPEARVGRQVFADAREEIERLRREDASLLENAGEAPSAYSGEEYRQERNRGMEKYGEEVKRLPWAAGSGYMVEGKQRGWAFCARVGERVYLRFVPCNGEGVARDTLDCLKQFACEERTEYHLPEDLKQGVYEAWQEARQDTLDEWMKATDPANLQPPVPRIFRTMAAHLRQYSPPGMDTQEIDNILERLEAPWPKRVQNAFRLIFDPDEEYGAPHDVSADIVEKVKEMGLQPFSSPEPLPPADQEQIVLICWMAVDTG